MNENKIERIKALIMQGNEFFKEQKYKEALNTFDKVISEEPRFFDALIGKMRVYRELYQWENVIICCDKILEINPKEITAIEHKIWSLYALDKIDNALAFARQAEKDYPDNSKIQKCITECLKKKQRKKIDKTLKHKPKVRKLKADESVISKTKITDERIVEKPTVEEKIPEIKRRLRVTPEISQMKKTNRFLIGIVFTYLMIIIVIYLLLDAIFFSRLNLNTSLFIQSGLYIILLASFLILIYSDKHTNLRELGISTQNLGKSIFIGTFASAGFLIVVIAFWRGPIINNLPTILNIGALTILIGIVEEFYFRGYLLGKARKSFKNMQAILITGVLFATLHIPKYIIAPLTTGGSSYYLYYYSIPSVVQSLIMISLLFGFIRENTKNIIAPIITHATWDFYLLIYSPLDSSIYTSYATPIGLASLAMLGTFFLAWGISSVLRVNILEDPRELPMIINELNSKAISYQKKASKMRYKVRSLSLKQEYYAHSNYYAYRSIELKKRKLESKLAFYTARKKLYEDITEYVTEDNFSELMDNIDRQLKQSEKDLRASLRSAVRKPVVIEAKKARRPRTNRFGYNISSINSRIRQYERRKLEVQNRIELFSMKQALKPNNPRYVAGLELKKERLRCQIEYFETLIDLYSNIAETISQNNFREKRKFFDEQKEIAKIQMNENLRKVNLHYYDRYRKT